MRIVTIRHAAPIEDPERLGERRAAMGLVPHAPYIEQVRKAMGL